MGSRREWADCHKGGGRDPPCAFFRQHVASCVRSQAAAQAPNPSISSKRDLPMQDHSRVLTSAGMVCKTAAGFHTFTREDVPLHVAQGFYGGQPSYPPAERPEPTPAKSFSPQKYTGPYLKFMTENPTVFHAVSRFAKQLSDAGYYYLSERSLWKIKSGGKYFTTRNGSSLIAFSVGSDYEVGNGIGIIAGHVDALTVKLKPIAKLGTNSGFVQLAVAPYAGGLNNTWWDRDLGIGGKVLVKNLDGKIEESLVKLDWPIARIPTLAPHFGALANGPFNPETQMVPIVGIDNSDINGQDAPNIDIKPGTFAATQPPRLVKAIADKMGLNDYSDIVSWELELFDTQPATLIGLEQDLISAGRIDDKLCCYAAIEALLASSDFSSPGIIKMVGCFDDEEVGSLARQGAKSTFMQIVIERIVESLADRYSPNIFSQTMANSFLVSSDVIHAVNPNFLGAYAANHSPRLNIGLAVSADANAGMTTDSVSTALLTRVAEKCGSSLQVFHKRNDTRGGGTIGPMTSAQLGCRAIDAGIPQLSMHSIRATTGSLDPGLGVKLFKGFFDYYEEVDKEFQ